MFVTDTIEEAHTEICFIIPGEWASLIASTCKERIYAATGEKQPNEIPKRS